MRVSTDTIAAITSDPSFHHRTIPPQPTVQELIDQFRADKEAALAALSDDNDPSGEGRARRAYQLETFNDIVSKTPPPGFEIVPVLYARAQSCFSRDIEDEYYDRVRGSYLAWLAENHADGLRRMGIAETGIERMKKRLDPTDDNGRYYAVSIDHIIERSGCGDWAQKHNKKIDPERRAVVGARFAVNHFGNMILMPDEVHELKNALNGVQNITQTDPKHPRWVLMLIPVRNAEWSGYVAPWQGVPLTTRPDTVDVKTSHANWMLRQTARKLSMFAYNHEIKAFHAFTGTLPAPANDNTSETERRLALATEFNRLVQPPSEAHRALEGILKPGIAETQQCVEAILTAAAELTNQRKYNAAMKSFVKFYSGRMMQDFRAALARLPIPEAESATESFNRIDAQIVGFQEDCCRPHKTRGHHRRHR